MSSFLQLGCGWHCIIGRHAPSPVSSSQAFTTSEAKDLLKRKEFAFSSAQNEPVFERKKAPQSEKQGHNPVICEVLSGPRN
jgi:hypothetical protein